VDWIRALKVVGLSLDLFGHPVTAHFGIPRSILAHSQNLSSLFSCVCSVSSLLAIAARLFAYAADEILTLDVGYSQLQAHQLNMEVVQILCGIV
jgi:hypothetical protein